MLQHHEKTKEQLIDEVKELHRRVSELEDSEKASNALKSAFVGIVEKTGEAVFVIQDGLIKFLNQTTSELTGYSKDEVLASNVIQTLVHPDDREMVVRYHARRLQGETTPFSYDYRFVCKDGTIKWAHMNSSLIMWGGKPAALCLATDITDRKQAEESVAHQLSINKSISELSIGVLAADSIEDISDLVLAEALKLTGSEFGYVGYIDPVTGYLVCPTLTRGIWDQCQVESKNIVFKEFGGLWGWSLDHKEALLSNDPTNDPRSGGTPAGHIPIHRVICVPAMDGTRLVGEISVANSGSDYTEEDMIATQRLSTIFSLGVRRKQAEDALRDSRELLRVLLDSIPVGMLYVDSAERIVFANKTFRSWWGKQDNYVEGCTVRDILGDYYLQIESRLKPVLVGKQVTYEETVDYEDGIRRNVAVTYVPHVGTSEEIKGFACLIADLTDRIKAEQEKSSLQTQLFQSQKMEALGTLVGGIAHDFNNMLQIMVGYCDFLLGDKKQGDPGFKELQTVIETGLGGADLVKKLLAFSQQARIVAVPFDLNHQIRELATLISHTLSPSVQIDLDLTDERATILADQNQTDQVIMNLAINASEAMPNGGRLSMATTTVKLDNEYSKSHNWVKPGVYVMLSVADTGSGMDKLTLARIFEPFFSTKQRGSTRGTGLGLSVAKGIIEQQSGHITCESQPGKGTIFRIYFPVDHLESPSLPLKKV